MAVGKVSLDDWPRFTWSLGCTLRPSPRSPPSSSEARLASTSFMFMLLCVPEPVCQTDSGNSSGHLPAITSSAARMMASATCGSSSPSSALTLAAARFRRAMAATSGTGIFSVEIAKKCSERWVCAPHRCCSGTSIGPKVSFSVRVFMAVQLRLRRIGRVAGRIRQQVNENQSCRQA
ncbi:Uncharacterised protein [Bordetella pertussis]|nr:Uncharacterised protein [Bordetella pertussis]